MSIKDQVDQLDNEIQALEAEIIQGEARLAGLSAQRASLAKVLVAQAEHEQRTAAAPTNETVPDLSGRNRTDAIVEVLRSAGRAMAIEAVGEALEAGGCGEQEYQVVASTLNYLHHQGRIEKPSRGWYSA